jgi:bifunctional oligoribonuclease and PAP phosphatase NrnA
MKMKLDKKQLKKAAELMAESKSIVVLGHTYPDGDAIGSVLGLAIAARAAGWEVQASWPQPFEMPHKYVFLPGADLLIPPEELSIENVVIAIDCASAARLEELEEKVIGHSSVINIDHHPDNSEFGSINLIDPTASASSEIIYRHSTELGLKINDKSALCLYTGIVTDTGRFQFGNTTAETLEAASEMVAMGVEPNTVYENVYQSDSLAYLKLSGEIITRAAFDRELGLIYGCITQADLDEFGVKMNETEDLIDDLRALKGHVIAALFKEREDGRIRVSLRSRVDFDVGSIARKLGGGGHRVAAGYTSARRNMRETIEELKEEIVVRSRSAGHR